MPRLKKTIHSEGNKALMSWLRACRQKKGLTMRQLAERLGVSHSLIGKIEQCERRLDVIEYVKICHALEIDPHKGIDIVNAWTGR